MNQSVSHKSIIYLGKSRLHRDRANVIQTLQMVQAFNNAGVAAKLVVPPWKNIVIDQRLAELGVGSNCPVQPHFLFKSAFFPFGFSLYCALNKRHLKTFDMVFVRSVDFSNVLSRQGIAHVLEVHEIYDFKKFDGNTRCVCHYVAISNEIKKRLIEGSARNDQVIVAHSGFNSSAFHGITPFSADRLREPNIVYIGRISPDRGLPILNALAQEGGCKLRLIGSLEGSLPISEHADYRGTVPHSAVPGQYEEADIVALPYQRQLRHADSISPIKLFEAMAAGRPIIASDLPSIREVLTHMKNGLLVNPDKPDDWIEAVRYLRKHPEAAFRMAEAARKDAKGYTWDERARTILNGIWSSS